MNEPLRLLHAVPFREIGYGEEGSAEEERQYVAASLQRASASRAQEAESGSSGSGAAAPARSDVLALFRAASCEKLVPVTAIELSVCSVVGWIGTTEASRLPSVRSPDSIELTH